MTTEMDIKIFEPPSNRRYWVVKADAGKYYKLFLENSLIAIGHFNDFSIGRANSNPFVATSDEIKKSMTIKRDNKDIINTNNFGQVNSFVNEMKIGDWVITKSSNYVRIGMITSEAMLDDTKVIHTIHKGQPQERNISLDFKLKRDVTWGPEVLIEHLPTDIFISLRSPMTLYNIDQHMESICFTLYPFFKINDTLHFSIQIAQVNDISNFYLTKVFEYLNELEFLSQTDIDSTNIDELYKAYIDAGIFNLSTQASFHSPGDIWAKVVIAGSKSKMINAILIYSMLFGNTHLGIDGIMDIESRQKIWDVLVKRIDMNAINETVKNLDLKMPEYDTKEIESLPNKDEYIV